MTESTADRADRAERALRDALSRHADDVLTKPLHPVRGRRRLPVAAAAAVALIAGVAWVVLPEMTGGGRAPSSGGPSSDPATLPGQRTVAFLDVSIAVPDTWSDDDAPTSQWCTDGPGGGRIRDDFPTSPYVARDTSMAAQTSAACGFDPDAPSTFPPVPPRYWAPHLSLLPGDTPDLVEGVETFEGWTLTTRVFGSVAVQLLTDRYTTPLVDSILATAAVRQTDAIGCDTTSPVQAAEFVRPPAFDVTGLAAAGEVRSVAVCQYRRGDLGSAGLLASRELDGPAASDLLDAVVAAPVGGGPDRPDQCVDDMFGDEAIVLRLQGADGPLDDLYVYYDWCFGNGIDDGTTRRAITRDNCEPLWGDPVFQYDGGGSTFRLCHPDRTPG